MKAREQLGQVASLSYAQLKKEQPFALFLKANLEIPLHLAGMFLYCERKAEISEENSHTDTWTSLNNIHVTATIDSHIWLHFNL